MKSSIRCRSLLWTPALNADNYCYAQSCGADMSIIDCEDAVAINKKDEARATAIGFLEQKHDYPYGIRINSLKTSAGLKDLEALAASHACIAMIIIPKVESPQEIVIANQLLDGRLETVRFCAIIETARGFKAIFDIASAGNNLEYLHGGPADLAADVGVDMNNWPGMDYSRTQLVLAARSAGIQAIEATNFDIYDQQRLSQDCIKAKQFGFVGKSAIHPGQIATINETFTPAPADVEKAREIIKAADSSQNSIVVVNGNMVGPPVVAAARQVLLNA